jgi:hypothetical protein
MAYRTPTYPVVSGYTNYGSFIPEIWDAKILEKYYDQTLLDKISNTDKQSKFQYGDTIIIRTRPTITIRDYVLGQALIVDTPVGSETTMTIDQGMYWNVKIHDVVEKQQDIDQMNLWATDAAEQLKIELDKRVLAYIPANVHAKNKGTAAGRITGNIGLGTTGSPVAITRATILQKILDMGQVLDEQNVPETGRFLILPFWATNKLKGSDLKAVYLTGDGTTPLRTGEVGRIDRFTIYNSNLLPNFTDSGDATTYFIAGTKDGLSFATQLTKTETYPLVDDFGHGMKSLVVFGRKVLRSECLTVCYVKQGTET